MSYRDFGPGNDHDEPELTSMRQGQDVDAPFQFPVVDDGASTPRGWIGPLAVAVLLAAAVVTGWSMTHRSGPSTGSSSSSTAATPLSTTSSSSTTTTAVASTSASSSRVSSSGDPNKAAIEFLSVWGQRTITAEEWERQIKPLCDDRGWFLMEGTDPANIPEFKIEGKPMVTPDGGTTTVSVSVRTSIGSSLITFVRHKETGRFLMHNFVVPGGKAS